MKIEELLKQIDDAAIDIQAALDEVSKDEVSADTLLLAASQVENLFKEIRTYGVSRQDMETLNALGLTNVETMYYNETRCMVGLKEALEADSEGGWLSLVIGGLMVALAAVLSFFVGKIIGWILGSNSMMDKASSSAASKSVVKIDKDKPDVGIPLKELGGKSGILDAVAVGRLGGEYVDGGIINKLMSVANDGLDEITNNVTEFAATDITFGNIKDYLKAKAPAEYAALGDVKAANKKQADAVIEKLNHSETLKIMVIGSYPIIESLVGKRLEDYKAKDASGAPITIPNSINAKSQRVIHLDTSKPFFDSNLTGGERFNISLDMKQVDFDSLNKQKAYLDKEIKQLEAAGLDVKRKGKIEHTTRLEEAIIKRVINIEVTYPTQYCIAIVRTVITKILTAMLHYKNAQTRLNVNWGGMFYQSQIDKVRALIKSTKADKALADTLKAKLDSLKDSNVKEAFDILAEIWDKLLVVDQHQTKQSADKIKFFTEYTKISPMRGDGLLAHMSVTAII